MVVQVGDVGDDTTHRKGVGRVPPQCGPQADWEATSAREGRHVDLPLSGGSNGGGGTTGGGDLHLPPLEQTCTVHCNQSHYGPETGGGADTRATGIQALVGIGRGGCGENADGSFRGGTSRGQ